MREFLGPHPLNWSLKVKCGSQQSCCSLEQRNSKKRSQRSISEVILGRFWPNIGVLVRKRGESCWFVMSLGLNFGGGGQCPPPLWKEGGQLSPAPCPPWFRHLWHIHTFSGDTCSPHSCCSGPLLLLLLHLTTHEEKLLLISSLASINSSSFFTLRVL